MEPLATALIALAGTGSIGAVIIFGVLTVKRRDQRERDRHRRSYLVTFPSDVVKPEQVINWLKAISGARVGMWDRFVGRESVVFETWSDSYGLKHRLKLPAARSSFLLRQLQSKVPGAVVALEEEAPAHNWQVVVELGESAPSRTLDVPPADQLSESLLASMTPLRDGEAVLFQWVLSPMKRERPPAEAQPVLAVGVGVRHLKRGNKADRDEVADRRVKLSESNFCGVLRVAAKAGSPQQAAALVANIKSALAAVGSPHNMFVPVKVFKRENLQARIAAANASFAIEPPVRLSVSELVGLLAWPIGGPNVAGLPTGRSRQLPPSNVIARQGRVMALATYPDMERPLAVSAKNALQHTWIQGPTGTGKSWAMAGQALDDIAAGHGYVCIDPKKDRAGGNLSELVLNRIPRHRADDVVYIDLSDRDYPVGFNVLQGDPQRVADNLQRLVDSIFPVNAGGQVLQRAIFSSVMTLMTSTTAPSSMTIAEIEPLCAPRKDEVAFADLLSRGVDDNDTLARFWQEVDSSGVANRPSIFGPLTRRIWQLNGRPQLLHMFGQAKSTINLREILSGQKILIINVAGEDKESLTLVGALLLNAIWGEIQTGACSPDKPVFMQIDEFAKLLHLPVPMEEWFSEARSQGLGVTVANQHVRQITERRGLLETIFANTLTKMIFRTEATDAGQVHRTFGPMVGPNDLASLGKHEVILQANTEAGPSQPVSGRTPDLNKRWPETGLADYIRAQSRAKYARPVAEVRAEIKARRAVEAAAPQGNRPSVGRKRKWD